ASRPAARTRAPTRPRARPPPARRGGGAYAPRSRLRPTRSATALVRSRSERRGHEKSAVHSATGKPSSSTRNETTAGCTGIERRPEHREHHREARRDGRVLVARPREEESRRAQHERVRAERVERRAVLQAPEQDPPLDDGDRARAESEVRRERDVEVGRVAVD